MDKSDEWAAKDFSRRGYYVADLEGKKVEVVLRVDGEVQAQLQLREPGLVAVVSRHDEDGFWIEVVGPGGIRYTDPTTPQTVAEQRLQPWHLEALGLPEVAIVELALRCHDRS